MTRQVRDANGRLWTLDGQLEWRTPATEDDFEHDVAAGIAPGVTMIVLIAVLAIVFISWTPADVVIPGWLILVLLLVFLFFPARWALRRPWTLTAETGDDTPEQLDGDEDDEARPAEPVERWVGTVRGYFAARSEIAKIAKNLQQDAQPGWEGVLKPIE